MTEVALGVHTENPHGAFDLYAGLGYVVVASIGAMLTTHGTREVPVQESTFPAP